MGTLIESPVDARALYDDTSSVTAMGKATDSAVDARLRLADASVDLSETVPSVNAV